MEENYLEKETREVIHRLKDFFSFEELKENFGFSYIAKDKDDSLNYHEYLEELERYLRLGHTRNRPSVLDLNPSFEALDKGAILSTGELYSIAELLSSSMDFYDQLGQEADFYHLLFVKLYVLVVLYCFDCDLYNSLYLVKLLSLIFVLLVLMEIHTMDNQKEVLVLKLVYIDSFYL